ncbi:MAG TPA: histidine phosphatase family protein [Gaiellaceae bacterium]|nr:histidine phosphatase family protein [Gaiellaceae bacterium]
MERLILARHGESTASAHGLVNGDPAAGVGLTPAGEEQARALGRTLAAEPLDLCVVTAFPRTRATAALALAGRVVPVEEEPGLGDPGAGRFEGCHLDEYRAWAWAAGSGEPAPGGGESRRAIVDRYAAACRALLARPEGSILVVAHALAIAYLLAAREGTPPAARMDRTVAYAEPYPVAADELAAALAVLDRWREAPTW